MKTRFVVILGFAVAFAAGVVVGLWARQQTAGAGTGAPVEGQEPAPQDRRSWLARELDLDPQQAEQVEAIWFEAMRKTGRDRGGRGREERRMFWKAREEAISALIRPEDKAAYDQVVREHDQKREQGDLARREAFEQAVGRTKAVLRPGQQERYEELLRRDGGDRWDGRGVGRGRRGGRDEHDREPRQGERHDRTGERDERGPADGGRGDGTGGSS